MVTAGTLRTLGEQRRVMRRRLGVPDRSNWRSSWR